MRNAIKGQLIVVAFTTSIVLPVAQYLILPERLRRENEEPESKSFFNDNFILGRYESFNTGSTISVSAAYETESNIERHEENPIKSSTNTIHAPRTHMKDSGTNSVQKLSSSANPIKEFVVQKHKRRS